METTGLSTAASSIAIGFVTGVSLIIAIGAQNAFVLRQGLRREHVLPIVLVCAAADAALISAGIAGLGAVISAYPAAVDITRYAGAAFVAGYGVLAARRAARPQAMTPSDHAPATLKAVLLTCLAFTFLNPHVYLDTVVLLGSIGNQHGDGRWMFGIGAVLGSFAWFFALGYGAGRLSTFFARPASWRVLDALIAAVMFALAAGLLFS
ncbi:amino acid transporter [Phytoactinopolyspora sp. XMNu-373]|uniref:Amino acid transporter n=1 Tax=Phytoactinopolyspora mesophila TaxID=2650750 RepID=A0A7K3M188_9ACTN|nr:LysE/ArgO family amino acid transporter [Phytoactinopolyspora mesophila]NDL56807.1 amino acid transporter [Phytoactinopolyspora mesophila]